MKAGTLFRLFLVVAAIALALGAGTAGAKAIRTNCSGTETLLGVLDPGTLTNPGGRIQIRCMVSQFREESSTCPQMAGTNTNNMNANWDKNGLGPMWGTFVLKTTQGEWKGTWHGAMGTGGSCSYEGVGRGVSGAVTGLIVMVKANCTNATTTWTSTILDPRGG